MGSFISFIRFGCVQEFDTFIQILVPLPFLFSLFSRLFWEGQNKGIQACGQWLANGFWLMDGAFSCV